MEFGDTIKLTLLVDNSVKDNKTENNWPLGFKNTEYELGIGDEVVLRRVIERGDKITPILNEDTVSYVPEPDSTELIEASGRIGSDGTVLLLDVGRLITEGKH